MSTENLHFKLRISENLLKNVAEAAKINGRTVTGEIRHVLEREYVKKENHNTDITDLKRRLEKLELFLKNGEM